MSSYRVSSRCECQAALAATLDENHFATSGTATRAGRRENAPAHSIGTKTHGGRFDVAWLCPYCGRNTLRTFYTGALRALQATP
jgi:hypothetical protein